MAEWKTGDVITAERLNGMMPLILRENDPAPGDNGLQRLDHTAREILEAFENGRLVYIALKNGENGNQSNSYGPARVSYVNDNDSFSFQIVDPQGTPYIATTSFDEYPILYD